MKIWIVMCAKLEFDLKMRKTGVNGVWSFSWWKYPAKIFPDIQIRLATGHYGQTPPSDSDLGQTELWTNVGE